MDFKLSQGPWEQLFSGDVLGFETEIYSNTNSFLLSIIYEKERGKKKAGILEIFQPLHAKGELEAFVETLPRKVISITSHSAEETHKFFFLDSGATYVQYEENAFNTEIDRGVEKVSSFSHMVKDISVAYDLELKDLKECARKEKEAFFSIPLVSLLIAPQVKRAERAGAAPQEMASAGQGEIVFGMARNGQVVREPLSLYTHTLISGGSDIDRIHLLHIFAESAMLSNMPVIILDWADVFDSLHYPNPDEKDLEEFKVGIEPVGFPLRSFNAGTDLNVDLGLTSSKGLLESFGVAESIVSRIIVDVLANVKTDNIEAVVKEIRRLPVSEVVTDYRKDKAVRYLRLMDLRYPGLFSGQNNIKQVMANWPKGLGRANLLKFKEEDPRQNRLILQSIIRGILEELKRSGKGANLHSMLLLTKAHDVAPRTGQGMLSKETEADLLQLPDFGMGLAVEAPESVAISEPLRKACNARASVIAGNDVGIQVAERQNFRVLIRPTLSGGATHAAKPMPSAVPPAEAGSR